MALPRSTDTECNGSFTYTPNANFNGSDNFTYKANDGKANSNIATVSITVNAVNDAPVAVNDAYSVNKDTTLTVVAPGVLGNDTDVDGDPLTAVLVSGVSNGSLTLNSDGSFSYTPIRLFSAVTTSPTRPTMVKLTPTSPPCPSPSPSQ